MTEILISDAIKIRRTSAGMSELALGRAIGVSQTFIRNLEAGLNHESLTLRLVARLADVLGTDIAELVGAEPDASQPAPDDIRVEALLADAQPYSVAAHEIAAAFDWPLRRAYSALRQLRSRLTAGGTRLREASGGTWRITASQASISAVERERLAIARLARSGLNLVEARVLREVTEGLVDQNWDRTATRSERIALGRLLKARLVVTAMNGMIALSPSVESSLNQVVGRRSKAKSQRT
jgi:transcriptional regulator with XRE-family HTH domain